MTNFDIKISIPILTDYSESLKPDIDEETLLMMIKSFSEYIANFYGRLIEEAMNSNRYKGKWEPIEEEGYAEYLGTTPEGNILEYIADAIEVKKLGTNFIVRIDPAYKYPGSKLTLIKVLRAIDSGTSKFNARPIFNRIVRQINSHLLRLWRGFLKMKGVI